MADATYQPLVYKDNGGNRLNVISGATLNVEAGATETHANIPAFTNTQGVVVGGSAAGAAGAVQSISKAISAIADNTATTVLTVTVPNAAHAAVIPITILASLGAGGAIGANEETLTGYGQIVLTRTAGVACVASAIALTSTGKVNVAGADSTATLAYSVTAMTGATSVTQTFNVQVTIAHGGGSSANHTALIWFDVMNANASGVTVA